VATIKKPPTQNKNKNKKHEIVQLIDSAAKE
jgi:hypothetical protein